STWGWRVPFLVGAIAGLVVMYLRRSMTESAHFQRAQARTDGRPQGGLRTLLTQYPKQLIAVLGLAIGSMVLTVPIMTILGGTRNPWTAFLLITTALVFLTGYTALSAII